MTGRSTQKLVEHEWHRAKFPKKLVIAVINTFRIEGYKVVVKAYPSLRYCSLKTSMKRLKSNIEYPIIGGTACTKLPVIIVTDHSTCDTSPDSNSTPTK